MLDEILAMKEMGVDIIIIPRNPTENTFHGEAFKMLDQTIRLPLLNWGIFFYFLLTLTIRPRLCFVLISILLRSRSLRIMAKNLAVVPKSVYVASLIKKRGVNHIHAHWGSTTASMAFIMSELTRIPWSFTVHRWDIAENNMLKQKVQKSAFVRCISEDGSREVVRIVGTKFLSKIKVLHLGIPIPDLEVERTKIARNEFIAMCPASFVLIKGHSILIEACGLLYKRGIRDFLCLLVGEGPLERTIREQIRRLGLNATVQLLGCIPHDQLMNMFSKGDADVVVLPSIITKDGEREGIPVALMEAMAYGIPVISTETGGIAELLSDGAGIMVEEKNAEQLATALEKIIRNKRFACELGNKGRKRVNAEFNILSNTRRLLEFMSEATE